jgi:hypothetical protein
MNLMHVSDHWVWNAVSWYAFGVYERQSQAILCKSSMVPLTMTPLLFELLYCTQLIQVLLCLLLTVCTAATGKKRHMAWLMLPILGCIIGLRTKLMHEDDDNDMSVTSTVWFIVQI